MSDIRDPRKLYAQCVEQCADSLYRVAFRLTGSEAEARDLVQETFLQAWRSLDSLREVDRMRSWMFSILRNQHSKLVRKDYKLACSMISQVSGNQDNDLSLAELAVSSSLESDERLEREEERQQLQSAIDQVKDKLNTLPGLEAR